MHTRIQAARDLAVMLTGKGLDETIADELRDVLARIGNGQLIADRSASIIDRAVNVLEYLREQHDAMRAGVPAKPARKPFKGTFYRYAGSALVKALRSPRLHARRG